MKVVDPKGRTWRVSRRWMPWRRRSSIGDWWQVPNGSGLGDDPISMIIGVLLLILIIPIAIVALVVALELLLLLLLLPFVVLGRVVFGRHWRVEARRGWEPVWEDEAGDWGESGRRIAAVAELIRRGELPPLNVST